VPALSPELEALIAQLSKHVQNRYYKNQTIYLDGYTFDNCCFNNCSLITDIGTFVLRSCAIFDNCSLQYTPNAMRIIKLWNTRNINTVWPDFNPTRDPDGSVTIE